MRIVCFTAHPDDETVFTGGTLALLSGAGAETSVICATRGEGGEMGEPPVCLRAELGPAREGELRCAARALGCRSVAFLPFRDPIVGVDGSLFPYAENPEAVIPLVADLLQKTDPDVFITHGSSGEYGHPAHRLTHLAGVRAAQMAKVPLILTFGAIFAKHPRPRSANRNDSADMVVDVSAAFPDKLAAMRCHRTQGALFVRRPTAEAGHPVPLEQVIVRMESFHRVAPGDDAVDGALRGILGNAVIVA